MFRNKDKFIKTSEHPVLVNFFLSALEKSRENVKSLTNRKNKAYTSIISASNDGCGWKYLSPALNSAINEAFYEAAATDITSAENRVLEEAQKNLLRAYLTPN